MLSIRILKIYLALSGGAIYKEKEIQAVCEDADELNEGDTMAGVKEGKPMGRTAGKKIHLKSRRLLAQFLIICVPLWLSIKFYSGPYHEMVRTYLACILFIIISALVVQMIVPTLRETPLLITLFLVLCAVELVARQFPGVFDPLSLAVAGQPIIGDVFSINKIPYYGVGAFIGYFVLKACRLN
jgi:hypothetical protein